MIKLPDDRRGPLTPQLALRVAILGSFALAMFAIIFFRLWYLQVLSGDQYRREASTNQVRNVSIPAPRGEIVDHQGNVLVDSRQSIAVQISPPDLPHSPAARRRLYRRLAAVLGTSTKRVRCPVDGRGIEHLAPIPCDVAQEQAQLPYANVTVKTDVSSQVLDYLLERQTQFPGVNVQQVWLRSYPFNDLAAQLFGTVGRITPQEIHDPRYKGVSQNDVVGQSGLEWYYDKYLRGQDGADRVQVNALGHFTSYLSEKKPRVGSTLKLSLDLGLQKAGQAALQESILANPPATAGAFVALDPQTGAVYAMGSLPTFNPNIFAKPVPESTYKALNNVASGYPLFNRAIQSAYPTGSTFKGITATAALQSGVWNTSDVYDDTGVYQNGPGDVRHNAGHASYGVLDITHAIQVSSDDFFYNLGRLMNDPAPKGGALQQWAHAYGIGRKTGIDVGGENPGILPSPEWRTKRDKLELQCERKQHHANASDYFSAAVSCGIADGRPWSVGDNENLAVGQGDLEATPLQLAVAYSTIDNGGTVVRPHVGLEIDAPDGTLIQKIDPPAARHIHIDSTTLDAIHTGLHLAASAPGGTSADVFAGWPQGSYPVYGKTGTAQHSNQADQAWYVCYVPDPVKPILVAVTVEQGGFGAAAAAPVARQILSQWFFGKRGKFVAGASRTL
jgi:penicillin-binding protein 2